MYLSCGQCWWLLSVDISVGVVTGFIGNLPFLLHSTLEVPHSSPTVTNAKYT
jgi:hypothetical protein